MRACKDVCGDEATLKVILETGCLRDQAVIADAASAAIEAGADFIKTSTGKSAVSATFDTARTMLRVIQASGRSRGFKASGGIGSAETAARYLDIAAGMMGEDSIQPHTFRFGASGVLTDLLSAIDGRCTEGAVSGY